MKKHLLLLLTLIPSHSCSAKQEQTWNDYLQKFNKEFRTDMNSKNVAGAGYALFDDRNIICSFNYGFADKSLNDSTTITTRYLIGSLTKLFTAVSVLQLYEKGLLDLDAPVTKYIPDFSIKQRFPGSGPITIRSILTHHSGLPTDIYLHKFSDTHPPFETILDYLNHESTCLPAGKIKSYSNLGYALLGILIERISGKSYTGYVQESIIRPLEMNNTGFYLSANDSSQFSAAWNRTGNKAKEYPIYDVPAGAIYSTIQDLIKFGQVFLGKENQVLHKKTIDLMFQLQNKDIVLDLYERSAICFNFRNKASELGRTFEHGGATLYHRSQLFISPDSKLGTVLLSNSPEGVSNSWKLQEQLMTGYLKMNNKGLKIVPDTMKQVNFTSVKNKNLKSFAGIYAMPGMVCTLEWKDENLYAQIQGNEFYLVPEDDHSFVPAKKVLGKMVKSKNMWFFLEELNNEKLFIQGYPWGDLGIIGQSLKVHPIPEKWMSRIGKYEITNQDASEFQFVNNVEIKEKNGFLVLQYSFHPDFGNPAPAEMALELSGDNEAFILGLGRGGGESVTFKELKDPKDQIFNFYGLEARKVRK